jgi:hypothetical protein
MGTLAANVRTAPDAEPSAATSGPSAAARLRRRDARLRVLAVCCGAALLGAAYGIGRLEGELARDRVADHAAAETEKHLAELDRLKRHIGEQRERLRLFGARRDLHRAAIELGSHNFGTARQRVENAWRTLTRPEVAPQVLSLGTELKGLKLAVTADVATDRDRLDTVSRRLDTLLDAME